MKRPFIRSCLRSCLEISQSKPKTVILDGKVVGVIERGCKVHLQETGSKFCETPIDQEPKGLYLDIARRMDVRQGQSEATARINLNQPQK